MKKIKIKNQSKKAFCSNGDGHAKINDSSGWVRRKCFPARVQFYIFLSNLILFFLLEIWKSNFLKLSHKLVRLISKQTETEDKINQNCQVVTAIIQAFSSKKSKGPLQSYFSIKPPNLDDRPAFEDWMLNYRSLLRLSEPLPVNWRARIWKAQSGLFFKIYFISHFKILNSFLTQK